MRTRLKNYRIEANYQGISNCIVLDSDVITSVEDIRLIVNETQRIVIASSMKKSGVSTDGLKSITPILNGESVQVGTVLEINTAVCTLVASPQPDKLTIEIDKGTDIGNLEKAAQESTPFAIEQSIGDLPASGKTVHQKISDVNEILNILNGTDVSVSVPANYATESRQITIVGDTSVIKSKISTIESDLTFLKGIFTGSTIVANEDGPIDGKPTYTLVLGDDATIEGGEIIA